MLTSSVTSAFTEAEALQARLEDPKTLTHLTHLLDKLPEITMLLELTEGFLSRGPEFADNVQEGVQMVRQLAEDHAGELQSAMTTFGKLQETVASEQAQALMASTVFSPNTLELVNKAAQAATHAAESYEQEPKVTLFGLMRAISDPEMQRGLKFLLSFAKTFGKSL